MRQYDRAGPVGQGMGQVQIGCEIRFLGVGHGTRLGGVCPCESRLRWGLAADPCAAGAGFGEKSGHSAPLSLENCGFLIAALIFVRRNDILLQRGMTDWVVPLPSLGVSSLDLGRSFNRTAHFFVFQGLAGGYSAAARGMARPGMLGTSARTTVSRLARRRSNPADFWKLRSSM